MKKPSMEAIKNAMCNAKASIEASGFRLTSEQEELVKSKLLGEVSEEEFFKRALAMAKK